MGHHTCHTLFQIISRIRRVQVILLRIKHADIRRDHRLCRILGIHDILIIPVLHDKGIIRFRRQKLLISIHQLRPDLLLQRLPAGPHSRFLNAILRQCLCRCRQLFPCICQLHVQKFLHCTHSLLLILPPAHAVITQEIRCIRIKQFSLILLHQNLRLANIGIVLRL